MDRGFEFSGDYTPTGKSGLVLVDVPGHERLRQKYIEHYKGSVRGVIYVIDSSNVQKQLRDTAEFLFNIISDPTLFAARPPVLVACNKQDVGLAKGSGVIRRELQRELNLLRDTHSRSLQGTNDTPVVDHMFLGREGHDFDFQDLPMKVTTLLLNSELSLSTLFAHLRHSGRLLRDFLRRRGERLRLFEDVAGRSCVVDVELWMMRGKRSILFYSCRKTKNCNLMLSLNCIII